MKNHFVWSLILVGILISNSLFAQHTVNLDSKIESVTVYRQRAQITRTSTIRVQPGENILTFSGLSQHIKPQSMNVRGEGEGIIQSVRHRVSYLNRVAIPEKVQHLQDSVKALQGELAVISDEKFVNETEEKLLLANQKLAGEQTGLDVEALREMATLYRERLTAVRRSMRRLNLESQRLNEEINRLNAEINSLQRSRNQPTQEVVVVFVAEKAERVKLELTYLVDGANWNPFYDLRVSNTEDPIQLALKANVVNNTGIDWEGVNITLSTTKNAGNNTAPQLNPQYLAFWSDVRRRQPAVVGYGTQAKGYEDAAVDSRSNTFDMVAEAEELAPAASSSAADYTTTHEGELGLEFVIALEYDIPADGQEHQVDILQSELEAQYRHYTVPKLDQDVFLVADIQQDLLRGNANVYFEGTFVGETFINTDNPRDSMRISLGRDPKVQVQREQVTDYTARQVIGGKVRQTYAYEITLRNNKASAVTVSVQDQLPLSQNKDIEVEALELSGAQMDATSGRLDWLIELAPGEERTLELRYEVKYPKDQQVTGL